MADLDIRWQQRFSNFEKAFLLLQNTLQIEQPSIVERAGLIQFFEMTFELSWKLLKDYEEAQGFLVKTPRETIRQAFQISLIGDGHGWLRMLQDRNLTAHTYNETVALEVDRKIRQQYFPLLEALYDSFKQKL
ncbi:MAG: nucleotidyltransferase [Leptolyngbya sp. SIO4C1]|nr:nucleotidyltransferase [Leptolyngbya sp. SIO4C1]